tara:strand:+ start:22758 stop:23708 length:951 start_codon:yes stop_codon:yes gene_type:complete
MRILITGGLGYIGFFTIRELIKNKKNKITVIDNFNNNQNIKHFRDLNIKIVKSDFSNKKVLKTLFNKNKFDILIHLASYKKVHESVKKPIKYYYNNVVKTKKLFKFCVSRSLKNFIFASSASVYGKNKKLIVEESLPLSSLSPYAKNKIEIEIFLKKLSKKNNIKYFVLRYFNVAGSISKNKNKFKLTKINNFIHKAKRLVQLNKFIPIYGKNYSTKDGTVIRDFIHIEDVAKINSTIVKKIKQLNSQTLNIGSGKGITLLDVIKIFKSLYKNNIKVKFSNRKKGDIEAIIANNKKMKKSLSFTKIQSISKIIESI